MINSFNLNENFSAMVASHGLRSAGQFLTQSAERLATGLRVSRAADGPAILTISERMRSEIRGFARAAQNSQDGVSLLQTAEGALDEIQSMLHRLRELAVQGANDTLTPVDRSVISAEMLQLSDQMTDIANQTTFNGRVLLNGSLGASGQPLTMQVGSNGGDQLTVTIEAADATTLGVDTPPTGANNALAWSNFIATVDGATAQLSTQRGALGDEESELKHFLLSLSVAWENSKASDSRFRDTDLAQELINYARAQILKEPGMAALVHSNLIPQTALAMYDSVRQPGQRGA